MRLPIFLVMLLFFAQSLLAQSSGIEEKVESLLLEKFVESNEQAVLIQLATKADLSKSRDINDKGAKGRYVFETLQAFAFEEQQEVVASLDAKGKRYRTFYLVNAVLAVLNEEEVRAFAKWPSIRMISSNPTTSFPRPKQAQATAERSEIPWGILMMGADKVWGLGYTGQGVVVGGQDTGIKWDHVSLQNKYRGWNDGNLDHNYNWHDAIHAISPLHDDPNPSPDLNPCGLDALSPCDDNGHGTLTMGVMVGSDEDDKFGVAPEAQWVGVRNMERGYGSPASYLEGFEWFLAPTDLNNENPDPSKAPHVINNSWSCPEMEGCDLSNFDLLKEAINNLKAAGIVVVSAAGNEGPDCSTLNTPSAIFENTFSVGATGATDSIAEFSSRGPVLVDSSNRMKPNVSAPGVGIRSAWYEGGYGNYTGTSLAGPNVAGVVALMISANPEIAGQVELIESIIENTAVPKTTEENCGGFSGTEVPNPTYGFGRIDALAAVQEALLFTATTQAPEFESLALFPNPAKDQVSITVDAAMGQATVVMYDRAGRVMKRWKAVSGTVELSLAQWPAGIYFIEVQGVEKILQGRLSKI